ncbi:hypothetical protein HPB48_023193 [Haemaphysalis longicornis]|uniref:Vacuolar protein-sorting-associated protein 36 n=1 Tax=Haemaphysalis longicornis TaxID=44386 RepID=A0A9J6H6E3_HAELO|nr:hypothetical protein HPB48_023193 [Haemaphysalis longicornis]
MNRFVWSSDNLSSGEVILRQQAGVALYDATRSMPAVVPEQLVRYVRFSFRSGGASEFYQEMQGALQKKDWLKMPTVDSRAKEMVALSKSISQKLKEKGSSLSDDETIMFKSHLLSLGISDPVTKSAYGSSNTYHRELAKQLAEVLEQPVRVCPCSYIHSF